MDSPKNKEEDDQAFARFHNECVQSTERLTRTRPTVMYEKGKFGKEVDDELKSMKYPPRRAYWVSDRWDRIWNRIRNPLGRRRGAADSSGSSNPEDPNNKDNTFQSRSTPFLSQLDAVKDRFMDGLQRVSAALESKHNNGGVRPNSMPMPASHHSMPKGFMPI